MDGRFAPDFAIRGEIMKRSFIYLLTIIILIQLLSCSTKKQIEISPERKFNHGHYVALNWGEVSKIKYLDEPAVIGVNKRYNWRILEPEEGEYDFSEIENDLEYLSKLDKQLIVFIIDKSFWIKGALPSYLSEYDIRVGEYEYGTIRWHPEVVERYVALGKALGTKFDSHPNFEGLAVQESALGLPEETYAQFDYTPEKYRDALITILTSLKEALPNSNVFWYSNFMNENDGHLRQVADAIEEYKIFMGGPDILPYNRWISIMSYPMYEEYKDRLILFCSAQDDSYMHHKNDIRVGEIEPVHEEGYLTMEEIFLFARDSLHVRYLFWNYFYEKPAPGVRSYDDAIEVIRKYPSFN